MGAVLAALFIFTLYDLIAGIGHLYLRYRYGDEKPGTRHRLFHEQLLPFLKGMRFALVPGCAFAAYRLFGEDRATEAGIWLVLGIYMAVRYLRSHDKDDTYGK